MEGIPLQILDRGTKARRLDNQNVRRSEGHT